VTNIAPDHLDRHGTMEQYVAAKWPIASNQSPDDWLVLNADCELLDDWQQRARSQVCLFSSQRELARGTFVRGDRIVVRLDGKEDVAVSMAAVALPGAHNLENALAAICACALLGLNGEEIATGLRSFEGVEHRLEFVAQIDGVRYYNDSKATTPDSTIVALKAFDCPVVLIAGGSGKGLAFDKMAEVAAGRLRAAVMIGKTADEIARCLHRHCGDHVATIRCSSLADAVGAARAQAQPGDLVLLSPGDASYDMFRNYEERGRMFKEEVLRLASDAMAEKSQGR